ncbi:MAG: cell division protein FtsA [Candidatus Symbiobacter sp.]|nr:cell division protein FtsA [Candidatus Symbiobacter sp.]
MTTNRSLLTRRDASPAKGLVAALDIGSHKTVAVIARAELGGARVLGYGVAASAGIKSGNIIEMEPAIASISDAVAQAERMADSTIDSVLVNVSSRQLSSRLVVQSVPLASRHVTDADIRQTILDSNNGSLSDEWQVLHMIPTGWSIDGSRGIRDPRGMHGESLAAHMNIVSAPRFTLKTLTSCVALCHLDINSLVASPFAAGLSSLLEDDRAVGVTLIDLGAGVTSASVFIDGAMVYLTVVPVGGQHVTNDIADILHTSIPLAEELKLLYGEAEKNPNTLEEQINAPCLDQDRPIEAHAVSRWLLTEIIQHRIEEIFELIRNDLIQAGFYRAAGRRVVLTGGGSNLPGVREVAARILDKTVRLGRPLPLRSAPEILIEPQFSVVAGLIAYGMRPVGVPARQASSRTPSTTVFNNLGLWLKEIF